jgi:hypothetical protein
MVLLVEQDLALQVRLLDEVAVDDPQRPDPGARQQRRLHRPERPAADQDDARRHQPGLALGADLLEQHLPGIAGRDRAGRRPARRLSVVARHAVVPSPACP